jgi:hypothetical protein
VVTVKNQAQADFYNQASIFGPNHYLFQGNDSLATKNANALKTLNSIYDAIYKKADQKYSPQIELELIDI